MEDGTVDLELLRVSLFGKVARNSLSQFDIDKARRLFPNDKGIQIICEQYRRNVAAGAAAAAEAKAADEAKIAAAAKAFAEKEAAAEAKAAEAAKATEKAKAAEVGNK